MPLSSTLRTLWRAIPTYLHRLTPFNFGGNEFEDIYNFLRIDQRLTTSGQPTEQQFEALKSRGIGTVINLAPHHAENALPDEPGCLAALGIKYIHIPVDFKNPTDADFQQFCDAMAEHATQPLHVHCAANMRVSAFMYRYRCAVLGEDPASARSDLERIWEPFGVWRAFTALD